MKQNLSHDMTTRERELVSLLETSNRALGDLLDGARNGSVSTLTDTLAFDAFKKGRAYVLALTNPSTLNA